MEIEDPKRLLLSISRLTWSKTNDKLAQAIVTELGSSALSVTQNGAYVYRGELLEQYKHLAQRPEDYQWAVFTTWRVNLRRISSQAAKLPHLFSFAHHDQVAQETFHRACVKADLETMIVDDEYVSAKDTIISFLSTFMSSDDETQRQILRPNHPDILNSPELLADVLQSMSEFGDRLKKAEAIAIQALEMRRRIYGEDHSRALSCDAVLARIRFKEGQ
ncbi:determination of stomach left/right asymmetry [Rhizoctonia solani]|uniref:Determination of stomach left/right asymmetry n=1 Tax=Rhizoctonia solani TaxID=456999 RepID=A0A8H7M1A1_9AGAM|nr:determination of stomach left/right asymmetry [Rhizoctonia solani]